MPISRAVSILEEHRRPKWDTEIVDCFLGLLKVDGLARASAPGANAGESAIRLYDGLPPVFPACTVFADALPYGCAQRRALTSDISPGLIPGGKGGTMLSRRRT